MWATKHLLVQSNRVGLFYLRVIFFYVRLVFVAYGQLAWSLLLTVEIRFGLLCLRWKIGLVFFTYGSSVRSFLLTVPPWPEIRFGLFCLRFSLSEYWVWSLLLTVPPP